MDTCGCVWPFNVSHGKRKNDDAGDGVATEKGFDMDKMCV
jgi:hypothetical protein